MDASKAATVLSSSVLLASDDLGASTVVGQNVLGVGAFARSWVLTWLAVTSLKNNSGAGSSQFRIVQFGYVEIVTAAGFVR